MKRILTCVLSFLLLFSSGSVTQAMATSLPLGSANDALLIGENDSDIIENNGFDSPEAAVTAYLEALRDADLSRMIDTFMIERHAENFNFEAQLNRARYYASSNGFPDANEIVAAMNIENYRKKVTESISGQYFVLSLFESGQDFPQGVMALQDDKAASDFYDLLSAMVNAPNLSTLKVLGFLPLEKLAGLGTVLGISDFVDRFYNEKTRNDLNDIAKISGADQAASCIAVFEINGNNYLLCLETYKYDGKWFIAQLEGFLGREIRFALRLDQALYGLLPLFHVSIYTAIDQNGVTVLNNIILDAMEKTENSGMAAVSTASVPNIQEGPGSISPEDAAKVYLEALRDADFRGMISAFAIERYARNYDLTAMLSRLRSYSFSNEILFPNANEFATSFNIERYRESVTQLIANQYLLLCNFESGMMLPPDQKVEDETAAAELTDQLLRVLNTPKLDTLTILGFIPLEQFSGFSSALGGLAIDDSYFDKNTQSRFAEGAKICGADRLTDCIAVFEIDGNLYLLCLNALEYDGAWFLGTGTNLPYFMSLGYGWMGFVPLSVMGAEAGIDVDVFRQMIVSN